jgi:hypothetical protein
MCEINHKGYEVIPVGDDEKICDDELSVLIAAYAIVILGLQVAQYLGWI